MYVFGLVMIEDGSLSIGLKPGIRQK